VRDVLMAVTPHRERMRKLREAKRDKPVPLHVAHGIYAYKTYRCRCDVCREANNSSARTQKRSWMRMTYGRWRDDLAGGMTSICWPPAWADRESWLCPGCGNSVGSSP
jgi:hypothetical protein